MEIRFGLSKESKESIDRAIKQLEQYEKGIEIKTRLLCEKLTSIGVMIAQGNISDSPLGKTIVLSSTITASQSGCKAIIMAVGETKQAEGYDPINTLLLVEFGAGIHFNQIPNPKANDFGMGVGTFPGQIHAFDDGWYYLGDDDKWHYTHGTKATMPMYHASQEIRSRIADVAREVFSNGRI